MSVIRVLHGAANHLDQHDRRHHPAVDVIEGDLWMRSGRLLAYHDRPLGPLPFVMGSRGFLSREPANPPDAADLVALAEEGTHLMLDLRSWFRDPAADAARALLGLSDRSRITISCEHWPIADRMRAWLPGIGIAYSIGSKRVLNRYLRGRRNGSLPKTDVSVRGSLLQTADDVEQLRELSSGVAAWTIDDVDRALELVDLGIDTLISNRLQVLNAI
jgi:hypothetical protein